MTASTTKQGLGSAFSLAVAAGQLHHAELSCYPRHPIAPALPRCTELLVTHIRAAHSRCRGWELRGWLSPRTNHAQGTDGLKTETSHGKLSNQTEGKTDSKPRRTPPGCQAGTCTGAAAMPAAELKFYGCMNTKARIYIRGGTAGGGHPSLRKRATK